MGNASRLSLRALILAVALTVTIFTAFVFGGNITTPTPNMTPLDEQALVGLGMSTRGGGAVEAPTQPMRVQFQELGSLWMSATQITDVVIAGDYAFAVGGEPGFMVFDISNPAAPQRVVWLRSTADFSYGWAIERHGSFVYLIGGTLPVLILDVSDPLNPVQAGSFTPPDNGQPDQHLTAMSIHGQYLYLLAAYGPWEATDGRLVIADLANPAAPALVGAVDGIGLAYAVTVEGGYAYIGRMSYNRPAIDALVVIDLSDQAHPVAVGELSTVAPDSSGSLYDIAVVGQRAYVTVLNRGLMIVDISNPTAPSQVELRGDLYGCYHLQVDGSTLYLSNITLETALFVLDISIPDSPTMIGELSAAGYFGRLELHGELLYCPVLEDGLKIVNVSNPAAPSVTGRWATKGSPVDLVISEGKAYVANGQNGLAIIDISDPAQMDTIGIYPVSGTAVDVALYGTIAYVATYDGLIAVDVSNPAAPAAVWGTTSDGDPQQVAITGHYLYSAAMDYGVYVYDITNPAAPVRVRQLNTLGMSWGIAIEGSYAYVADYTNGMLILDLSMPADPYIVGRYPEPQHPYESGINKVAFVNGFAYANSTSDGLVMIDVSVPSSPTRVGFLGIYDVSRMLCSGSNLYLGSDQLRVLDVTNPAAPVLIGQRSAAAPGIALASGYVYTAGFPGVTVLSMSDYFCGDLDNSFALPDIGDLSYLVDYLFTGGPAPSNPSAGNLDGSGGIDIADLTVIVDYLFFGQGTLNCF